MRWLLLAVVTACSSAPAPAPALVNHRAAPDPEPLAVVGNPAAAVRLQYWYDYDCPHCADFVPTLEAVEAQYGERIGVYYKNFPLQRNPFARDAAIAAEAARRQGKFIEMHRLLMATQPQLSPDELAAALQQNRQPVLHPRDLHKLAAQLQLDLHRFDGDLRDPSLAKAVDRDLAEGERAGIDHVPYLAIDGVAYAGHLELAPLTQAIDARLQGL